MRRWETERRTTRILFPLTRHWGELAVVFLGTLGTTAFGGPAAHIAMMEDEVVRRRGWLSREHFLDLLGVTNLLPGPNGFVAQFVTSQAVFLMRLSIIPHAPSGACLTASSD